jgi:xanthine dehydrogenase accessory factor
LREIYDILREWKRRPAENLALATLVHAEGSSYRRPGARMLICEDGTTLGSLSAGCLEAEVALRGREVLQTGAPALITFDTRKRFGCAGKIDIFIECVSKNFLDELTANHEMRRTCIAVTTRDGTTVGQAGSFPPAADAAPQTGEADSFPYIPFVQEIHPPIRVFVFGGGPDSAPLHSLANSLGWETFEVADANELPIEPDEWTAAIVKSHNYGRDFAALQKLLPLDLRYVGLIGPRKRRNELLGDLLDLGVTINAGFFAPAGLDLAAETPEEIALAIVSEIQRVFRGGSGESLRDRKISIHAPTRTATLA